MLQRRFGSILQFRARQGLAAAVLTLLAAAPAAQAQDGETIHFGFEPEAGSVWIREMTDRQIKDYGSVAPRVDQLTKAKVQFRYARGDNGQWIVYQTPMRATISINDEVRPNPALDLSMGHQLTMHIDEQGLAQGVDGFVELSRKFEREMEPEVYANVRRYTPDIMERQQIEEWNAPLEYLRGETVTLGDRWHVLDEYPMGNKRMDLTGVVTFAGWTELGGQRGVKVEYVFDTTGDAVKSIADEYARKVDRRQNQDNVPSNVPLRGVIVRVIEPASGQLLYETRDVEYEVPLGTTDGPTAKFIESHIYRYSKTEG